MGRPQRVRTRRRFAALTAAAAAILALLTVFATELSGTQAKSRQDVITRVHERSTLAAALIGSLLQSVEQQLPLLERTYGSPTVTSRTMNAFRQQNTYLALLDRGGRVLASSAGFTAQARRDLAVSAALALVRAGNPYGLGNLLPYGRTGVVNFAVALPTRYGTRYLLTGLSPRTLGPFLQGELRRIPGVKGSHNYVIDANDVVLASTNPARPVGYRFTDPRSVRALSRSSGDRDGHYYEETPITNATWRIVLAAPDGPLFASISGWRRWLPWLIFGAFALVALAALTLGLRVVRSAEIDLRESNARLAELNRELEQANQALEHDALHDPLTGLANRTLFMDRLEQAIGRTGRDPASGCAVLFIDLDRFKPVNDKLSHAVGDELLRAVAARFQIALRPGDTAGRIGGDEFAVLLEGVRNGRHAMLVAERVHNALSESFEVAGHSISVTASIGIALGSPDMTAAELLGEADEAMYEAKRRPGGGHRIFGPSLTLA